MTTPPSRLPRSWNGEGEASWKVPLLRAEGGEKESPVRHGGAALIRWSGDNSFFNQCPLAWSSSVMRSRTSRSIKTCVSEQR